MDIGFTGSSRGMTGPQAHEVSILLQRYKKYGRQEFHHGACVGADEEAAKIARDLGYITVAHPGNPSRYTTDFVSNTEYPPTDNLDRNMMIVDACDFIIATPKEFPEVLRSGTWMTIRYARKRDKPCYIVRPDGSYVIPEQASATGH